MKNKIVLVISPEAWGINFVSKHHYANHLAKENTVYFLNPPKPSGILPKGMDISIEKVKQNLSVVNYHNLLPKLDRLPLVIQLKTYRKQAEKIQQKLNIDSFDIIWNFDPFRFYNQQVWQSKKFLYHCVDFHFTAKYEDSLIKTSNLTVVISDLMTQYFKKDSAKIVRIGHGFNPDLIDENITLPGKNSIKAMYVGNIAGLLDIERIIGLAKEAPTVDFILIGPYSSSNLSQSDNTIKDLLSPYSTIHLIGEVDPKMINNYLKKGDINLLLIRDRKEIPITNSHKLMDYFYSGNVTLSDYLIDYENVNQNLLTLATSNADFKHKFSSIISALENHNTPALYDYRKNHALNNSYPNKIDLIWNEINAEKI